jgi:hypothetical protein
MVFHSVLRCNLMITAGASCLGTNFAQSIAAMTSTTSQIIVQEIETTSIRITPTLSGALALVSGSTTVYQDGGVAGGKRYWLSPFIL